MADCMAVGVAATPSDAKPGQHSSVAHARRGESRWRRKRQRAYAFGEASERAVAGFLRAGAYAVLARRARIARCEVDVIAVRDDIVAFVEVKARKHGMDGLEAVTPAKMKRLSRAANAWLAENEAFAHCSLRFDIALVGRDQSIEYLENAYEAVEYDDFTY